MDSHIESRDAGKTVVLLMVRDAYANYVVQTTLDVIPDSEEKSMLIEELNVHADELVRHEFRYPCLEPEWYSNIFAQLVIPHRKITPLPSIL